MANKGRTWAICHFEDEPQRVDFPDLIEIALFQHPDFSDTAIESADDARTHVITFAYKGANHTLFYFIRNTAAEMQDCLASAGPDCRVVLSMMDLSINGDRESGASMVRDRLAENGSGEIWMVTGYPVEARRLLDEGDLNVRVIAKPPNHRLLRDEILALLLGALSDSQG
jgi:hypothetical protein